MINLISNYLKGAGEGGARLSALGCTQIKLENERLSAQAVLSGLPKTAISRFSLFPADWLSRYFDAKAVSPGIIRNYLKKVEEPFGTGEIGPKGVEYNFNGTVDGILEKSIDGYKAAEEPEQQAVAYSEAGGERHQDETELFGLPGEVFDQYA